MSRETENALLLMLGLSTAVITVTGTYMRYVKPSLLPWLAAVAMLLIILALSAIVGDLRARHDDHSGPEEHTGHTHQRGIGWLLTLPVVLLAFVGPTALGASAVGPSSVSVTLGPNDFRQPFPPLPAGRAPEVSLNQVMKRLALDSAGTLNGRLITVVGFTLKDGADTDLAFVTGRTGRHEPLTPRGRGQRASWVRGHAYSPSEARWLDAVGGAAGVGAGDVGDREVGHRDG